MSRRRDDPILVVVVAAVSFAVALLVIFGLSNGLTSPSRATVPGAIGTSGGGPGAPATTAKDGASGAIDTSPADVEELRSESLRAPIDGADPERWKGSFTETHNGHAHEAVDILAPRNTPIHAVSDGRIAKLFLSKAGGLTIYQSDPSGRFIFYYAHLQRYADDVRVGENVARGDVIGYVGTSGNAPPDTPHLHFAIFRTTDPRRWWQGAAIDPYLVYEQRH